MVSSVPVVFVVAIVDNYYAWDVSHDSTISTALSSVSMEPLAVSFSLTLVELVQILCNPVSCRLGL